MTKEDRAAYKASFIKGKTKIQPKGLEIEFYLEDKFGKFYLMAFQGTAGKPCAHYSFKTAEQRAAYMKRMTESAKLSADYKAKRKAETKKPRKLEVGHILYTSWGYDQTNVDYYQVTALKGETMVIVQKLEQSCPETGFMSGKALPAEKLIGKPIACRATGDRITVEGHAAWIWDGQPKYSSWYA
jgi:hypothetical protein